LQKVVSSFPLRSEGDTIPLMCHDRGYRRQCRLDIHYVLMLSNTDMQILFFRVSFQGPEKVRADNAVAAADGGRGI